MKTLSSSTLLHYTERVEYLYDILENDFSPRICIEKLNPFSRSEIAIPMKCFCDIPLSQVGDHTKQYGEYGIGLTKEWGKKKGISPVFYFNNKANHVRSFLDGTNK